MPFPVAWQTNSVAHPYRHREHAITAQRFKHDFTVLARSTDPCLADVFGCLAYRLRIEPVIFRILSEQYLGCRTIDCSIRVHLAPIGRWARDPRDDQFAATTDGVLPVAFRVPCCFAWPRAWSTHGSDPRRHIEFVVPVSTYGTHLVRYNDRIMCKRRRVQPGTSRRERARYGLRACRVGEARHPGPLHSNKKFHKGGQSVNRNQLEYPGNAR